MREYFINADFDIGLRPGRAPGTVDGRGRQAIEMPSHLLLLGVDGDSVLVDVKPDEPFQGYLVRAGLPCPNTTLLPEVTPGARLVPFGWDKRALELSLRYEKSSEHPPLEIVRRVNGRRFAAGIERELFGVDESLGEFYESGELESTIVSRPEGEEWLLKSEHGNAGLGNWRLRCRDLSPSDREVMARLLAEDVCVLLERWRRRELDICSVFSVDIQGQAKDLYLYEAVNTADGAYIGSIFEENPARLEPWRQEIADIVSKVARKLSETGYFGPVCLDHFVWSDGNERRLRPLADLNARLQVSAPLLDLWRSLGEDRVFYWRLFAARKLGLPRDYVELEEALGRDAFSLNDRCGVVVTSPFTAGETRLRRFGVLISARSREEVDEMDRLVRDRFER
jgi:hypothetical protein